MSKPPPYVLPKIPLAGSEEERAELASADRYFMALGKFTGLFTAQEAQLFSTLGVVSGIPIEIARALFAEARTDLLSTRIKRVVDARKQIGRPIDTRVEDLLDYVLGQLSIITATRNHLLHNQTFYPGSDNPIVSNWARATHQASLKEIPVSVSDLDNMREDLGVAAILLFEIQKAITIPFYIGSPDWTSATVETPWLYKSPLQSGQAGRTRGTTQEQPRRTPPSL